MGRAEALDGCIREWEWCDRTASWRVGATPSSRSEEIEMNRAVNVRTLLLVVALVASGASFALTRPSVRTWSRAPSTGTFTITATLRFRDH